MKEPELIDLAYDIIEQGQEGFMPILVNEIQSLIGEGNYVYDMWEFGPDGFSLFWWIRKDVYQQKMDLIGKWVVYNKMGELVDYHHEKENIKQDA